MSVYDKLPDWTDQTVALIGGGESLELSDVAYLEGRCKAVAINRAYRIAPWADMLFAGDAWFWLHHKKDKKYGAAQDFEGLKVSGQQVNNKVPRYEEIIQLPVAPRSSKPFHDPSRPIHYGWDSMYMAIQLVALKGAERVICMGLDGKGGNWHEGYGHRRTTNWDKIVGSHRDLAVLMDVRGVEVWNMNAESAVDAYLFCSNVRSLV